MATVVRYPSHIPRLFSQYLFLFGPDVTGTDAMTLDGLYIQIRAADLDASEDHTQPSGRHACARLQINYYVLK